MVEGGALGAVRDVATPEGTSIEVADLFYNLPARRKFLKSDSAESAQISRIVTQLALCYPEVGFTLTSAGRNLLQCPPVADGEGSAVSDLRRARRSRGGAPRRRRDDQRVRRGPGRAGADARPAEHLHQPSRRQGQDHRARDHRRLQRRLDQGAQSGSAPLHRDAARRGGRQRASDEGRSPVSRSVLHSRADSPHAR